MVNLMATPLFCSPFLFSKPTYFLLKERIIPIIPLEEKNKVSKRPNDNKPILFPSINESTKEITCLLYSLEGIISNINLCNSYLMLLLEIKGRLGMRVNKNNKEGGNAMMKLYAMAAALSDKPCCFTCFLKNCITSYNAKPSKPGRYQFLLFLNRKGIGVSNNIFRCILVKTQKLFVVCCRVYNNSVLLSQYKNCY